MPINDLPDVILFTIISAISDVRSRNSASLVSKKWLSIERSTRTHLTLRGNARDLFLLPSSFRSITHLDLSFLSPWGHPLDYSLFSHLFQLSFPNVHSLTIYSRYPTPIPHWPTLRHVKLVRWHQRPSHLPPGSDIIPVFEHENDNEHGNKNNSLDVIDDLDLSCYYCWTDDIPPALKLKANSNNINNNLTVLNLLNPAFPEGFRAHEVEEITASCPNLNKLLMTCMFDPRYIGFVGDQTLVSLARNCPKLVVLHLADPVNAREINTDTEDAGITVATLSEMFSGLSLLEEFTLDICNNCVRNTGPAFEMLTTKCAKLKSLKVGNFHGVVSVPVGSKLDGLALCHRLESLSIGNVADLTDMGLIAIARGCCNLSEFEVRGCESITVRGLRTFVCLLSRTLIHVKIGSCKCLGARSSLKALEPIQNKIRKLHIDCVWDEIDQFDDDLEIEIDNKRKKQKLDFDLNEGRSWDKLTHLSLWFPVGEVLTPLLSSGLEDCPSLEEINIKVEGDCRHFSKPAEREFGLRCLGLYPKLSKMKLDCGDTIGYAHTAPSGQMDLSLWERFYLFGIGDLGLVELDYWPPQDRDVNQRSLSLPAAGLLQECLMLRKLFIHGTAHEHFLMFLLRIPNLRDVQLREDYYPAPENDMSTEMRADSCTRFEDALNRRRILD